MKCNKCGNENPFGVSTCVNCGANLMLSEEVSKTESVQQVESQSVVTQHVENVITNNNETSINQNNITLDDEELVKAYIGDRYEDFKNGKFSFSAFFFGPMYCCYRRMWLYTIVFLIFSSIVLIFFNNVIIEFILTLILGFTFKPIYYQEAQKRAKKIKEHNPNLSREELIKLIQKKGGTNKWLVLAPAIVLVALVVYAYSPLNKKEPSVLDKLEEERAELNEQRHALDDIYIELPENARQVNETDSYRSFSTRIDPNQDSYCIIKLEVSSVSQENTLEKYLSDHSTDVSVKNEININGNTWNSITHYDLDSEMDIVSLSAYYITQNNNYIYSYSLTSFTPERDSISACTEAFNKFYSTAKFTK